MIFVKEFYLTAFTGTLYRLPQKNIYLIWPCLIWKTCLLSHKEVSLHYVFIFRINILCINIKTNLHMTCTCSNWTKTTHFIIFCRFTEFSFFEFNWPVCWRWQKWSRHDSGPPLHDYLNVLMNYKHSILVTGKQS